jgi:RNA polymerase sigma-32 factor
MRGIAFSPSTVDQSLSEYVAQIRRIPLLDAEREYALAVRWRQQGDHLAAQRLVTSHLRLVAKIAWGYRGYGLPISDLISEGTLGMLNGLRRFDPERGFRFATYATWWIRAQIQDYVLRSWSLVRLGTTARQRKLFFNLRRLKGQLRAIDDGELSPEAVQLISLDLNVPAADVVTMNGRLSSPDASLNTPLPDSNIEWQDKLVDESSDQESHLAEHETSTRHRALLSLALGRLSARERTIITARRLRDEPVSLTVLATRFGISTERIRQIEHAALAKLRRLVREVSRGPLSLGGDRRAQAERRHARDPVLAYSSRQSAPARLEEYERDRWLRPQATAVSDF